jgi:hypothetical protein
MEGFIGFIIVLCIAIGLLWQWANRGFNIHDRAINKLELEQNRIRKQLDLISVEMLKAQQIHPDTIDKLASNSDKWKWVQESLSHFLEQRTLLEQGDTKASTYSSMEEFELDYRSFLNDISEDSPNS